MRSFAVPFTTIISSREKSIAYLLIVAVIEKRPKIWADRAREYQCK
jgi:hypothetical protein